MSERFEVRTAHQPECEALAETLSAYVDGAASPLEASRVQAHLRSCPTCERTQRKLARLANQLRDLVELQPPSHLFERINDALASDRAVAEQAPLLLRIARLIQALLLRLYDGELARRVAQTGSCREQAEVQHGKVALLLGAVFALAPLIVTTGQALPGVLLLLPLIWLTTTRLEVHWRAGKMAGAAALGATCPWFLELHFGATVPLALCGSLVALATIQALAMPRLRPEVLLLGRVSMVSRAAPLLLAALVVARPDQLGLLAAAPLVSGLVGGALAHVATRRKRLAA